MNPLPPAALLLALFAAPLAQAGEKADQVWHRAMQVSTQLHRDGSYDSVQSWDVTADNPSAARAAAAQSFGFSSGLEDVTVLEAWTRKADGTRLPVGPDAVVNEETGTAGAYPSFDDWQDRTLIFPDVRPGDTVHYVLRRHSRAALFPGQFETALHPGPVANVTSADITVTAPAGLALHASAQGLDEAAPVAAGGEVTRSWHLAASGDEAGSVGLELSTFADYAALGDAYAARALPMAEPTDAIRALADRLTAGVTDRREQARLLYEYVAGSIRYVALQFGAGRVVPHPAEAVLRNAYGDCKDHAALLGALLAAKGIFAEPALITVKSRYRLPAAPTLSVLDHVILFVPEFDLFLDSTSPFAPFGVLPFGDYGKPVVLAGPGGARLDRTPALPDDPAITHVAADITLASDGDVSGRTMTSATGPASVALREIASGIESAGPASAAADRLRRLGTPGQGGYSFGPPLVPGRAYALSADFHLDDRLDQPEDRRFVLSAGLSVLARAGNFLVSSDATPEGGHLCYAGRQVEDVRLHLPPDRTAEELPPDMDRSAGFARYSARYTRDGDAVVAHRVLTVVAPRPVCTVAEFDAMEPALHAARSDARAEVTLGRAVAVAGAGSPAAPGGETVAGKAGHPDPTGQPGAHRFGDRHDDGAVITVAR